MIKHVKTAILSLSICIMCSGVYAAQKDLDNSHISMLKQAYNHILAKEYDLAKELYNTIQITDGVETGLRRAAIEGEGLALLLDLNDRVLEAKDNSVKLRLLRFQRRTTVSYLEKAIKRHPDETLNYMLALAKEEGEVSDKTFDGLRYSEEYKRLLATKTETVSKPSDDKKITVAIKPAVKPSVIDDSKIQGARTTVIPSVKYRAKGSVNVRSGPGTNYASIAKLNNDQEVIVVKSIRLLNGDRWLKIKKGTRIGYASARFLTQVTKATVPPKNDTSAKTVKTPPAKAVEKPVKVTNASNQACVGGYSAVYLTKAKVKVLSAPGGGVRFSFTKNQRIKIVRILEGYLVVRTGSKPDNYVCGYIKNDASLKRVN